MVEKSSYFGDIKDALRRGEYADVAIVVAVWIILVLGIVISFLDYFIFQHGMYVFEIATLAGWALYFFGLWVDSQAKRTLGEHYSPVVKTSSEHKLITQGIYRHIRHPIYLGLIISYLSIPLLLNSLDGLIVMVFIVLVILFRIRIEEKALLEKFGGEYRDYMKSSKRLIPHIW